MPPPQSPELRQRAVNLVRSGAQSVAQVALDFGVSQTAVRKWLSDAELPVVEQPAVEGTLRQEVWELRRQVRGLAVDIELLKMIATTRLIESVAGSDPGTRNQH